METRAQAEVCLNSGLDYTQLDLPYVNANAGDFWRFVKIDDHPRNDIDNPIAIAGTNSQVLVLQYDVNTKYFMAIRSLVTQASAVLFTEHTLIFSSDRYVEIDLQTLAGEEFLDMSDKSLLKAERARPMEAFLINSCEYLLCFKEFGIFVDQYGCRSRPKDLKWLRAKPNGFAYRAPLLFVSYDDGIQIIRLNKSEFEDEVEKHYETFISTENVRIMGKAGKYGIFTLSKADTMIKQLARINGNKALQKTLAVSMETILSNESDV